MPKMWRRPAAMKLTAHGQRRLKAILRDQTRAHSRGDKGSADRLACQILRALGLRS